MAKRVKKRPEEREQRKFQLKDDFEKRGNNINQLIVHDIEILSMHDKIIDARSAFSLWKKDSDIAPYLQNFVNYNREALSFLGVECSMSTNDIELILKASQLVGCAPLISPVTGQQCGNLIVKSEYDDDLDGIISLIQGDIDLQYRPHLHLNSSPCVTPPIYLECIRYLEEFSKLDNIHWKKFSNLYKDQSMPSSTDWGKYALRSFNPEMRLKFPNRINQLTTDHQEWMDLIYVLSVAIEEIQAKSTPNSVRHSYLNNISQIRRKIPYHKIKPVKELKIHKHDPLIVQKVKAIGNNVLKNNSTIACAWTFNITKLYERYVQFIFGKVAQKLGGQLYSNCKNCITGERPSWGLHYLEPDIILRYRDEEVVVDAKYKSHMMNLNINTETLRNSFRDDLHQVLAYSSLSVAKEKKIILCYPHPSIIHKVMHLDSSLTTSRTTIYLLGIPVNKNRVEGIVNDIFNLLKSKSEDSQ